MSERTLSGQDGRRLFYRDYGPRGHCGRAAALCLPGLTRNGRDFDALARHLALRRRVLCPDLRGRGGSEPDPDWRNYDPRVLLADIRHLLAAANVHRAVVIGTSLGGILAAALAVASPTAVAGVVLNDIGPEQNAEGTRRMMAYVRGFGRVPDWTAAVAYVRRCFPDLPARTDVDWLTVARNTYREEADGALVPDWDPAITRPIAEATARGLDLWPLFRALRRIPVLAVRGAKSDILDAAVLARMESAIPSLRAMTVADCGHAPDVGAPEVRTAIDALFARVDADDNAADMAAASAVRRPWTDGS